MKILNYISSIFLLFILNACKVDNSSEKNENYFFDYFNRSIKISENTNKVIPLYYVQAEIICSIGGSNKIVGIGKINEKSSLLISTLFPQLLNISQVGNQNNIDFEKIILLKPDVVFTGVDRNSVEKLEQLGFIAFATYPNNLQQIVDEIEIYGKILNKEKEAQNLIDFINNLVNQLKNISSNISNDLKTKVYYIRTDHFTTLGGNILGEIFDLAGGKLVTEGMGDNSNSLQVSLEDVYRFNPDVIIIRDRASIKPQDLYSDKRWEHIKAVKDFKIYQEHYGWTEFRIETIFGIIEKAKWFHPNLFKDFNPETEYTKFVSIIKENNK